MNLHENIQRIKEMMGLLTEDENEPAVKGDSNPLNLPYIDTWHNGQDKAQNDKTEEAIKLMTKAAEEAEKYAKENNDGGVAGEARYYRGTIAWLKKEYNDVEKYINDKYVKITGNDEVLKRLLKNKDKSYKEAYSLKEASISKQIPEVKGANHGFVIKQPYQEGQEGEQFNSFIIGVTHFDEKNPVYLKKDDINPSEIEEIKQVATNCGYYYEGIGGPDLINIERFFKEELGLNNIKEHGSYEPKLEDNNPDKKYFMYTFFSNGNAVDEKTKASLDGINQDKILLDQLSILKNSGQKINSIYDLIMLGDGSKLFWEGSLSFDDNDKEWFIEQIKNTPNTQNIMALLQSAPTPENIRKFIQSGFDVMWGNFDSKTDNFGYQDGKNLLTNMAEIATQKRREYIKNNLVCGIYFIGEGHIKSWQEQFVDTKVIEP